MCLSSINRLCTRTGVTLFPVRWVVLVLNTLNTRPWKHMGEWRYISKHYSDIVTCYTRWRWELSFTPRQLYPGKEAPLCLLDRSLGGPPSRFRRDFCETRTEFLYVIQPQTEGFNVERRANIRLCCPIQWMPAVSATGSVSYVTLLWISKQLPTSKHEIRLTPGSIKTKCKWSKLPAICHT
jgi:hypothetical protein